MTKEDRIELARIKAEMKKLKPGTPEYKALLEQKMTFVDTVTKEDDVNRLIPGVKNDTLLNGVLAGVQIATLSGVLDKYLVNGKLLSFLPKFTIKS